MDRRDYKLQRESTRQHNNKHRRENPSFSSTLLDSIYRSIDEGDTTMRKKQTTTCTTAVDSSGGAAEEEIMSIRRACLIEKWMEKKAAATERVVVRRNSMADFDTRSFFKYSSGSSSSDSSAFSSSESADSMYGTSCYSMPRPKPIRTSTRPESSTHSHHQKPKQENGFVKTKSKALKIYGDLKKVRQPISPGGKLATFLNSILGNGKNSKHKINVVDDLGSKSTSNSNGSNCSSASSFSRSCLRKASDDHLNSSAKRSVRFYPVSVIVDEDCRPCGHKTLQEMKMNYSMDVDEDDDDHHRRQVEEAARSYLMKNYQKNSKKKNHDEELMEEEEEDDDDAASYASSDLFELDTVGVEERYRQELPVYETTYFDRNRVLMV